MKLPEWVLGVIGGIAAAAAAAAAFFFGRTKSARRASDAAYKAAKEKRDEIENTDAHDLVAGAACAAEHERRIGEHKAQFAQAADTAVRDILRNAGAGTAGGGSDGGGALD